MRLVTVEVFILFCGIRIWNSVHQDCFMQWMRTIQIIWWNSVIGFCTCVMKEDVLLWNI